MRASLNEISEIEKFLLKQLDVEDALLFEARVLTNPSLRVNTATQQIIYRIVTIFYRKQSKQRLKAIHEDLFSKPDKIEFQKQVLHYFNQ